MKYVIETIKSTNFGDHGERLRHSHEPVEGESVEDLLRRVLGLGQRFGSYDPTNEVVLRLVIEPDGTLSGAWPENTDANDARF